MRGFLTVLILFISHFYGLAQVDTESDLVSGNNGVHQESINGKTYLEYRFSVTDYSFNYNSIFKNSAFSLLNYSVGVTLGFKVLSRLDVIVGIVYANKDFRSETYRDEFGEITVEPSLVRIHRSFIEIPIYGRYILVKMEKFSVHAQLGPAIWLQVEKVKLEYAVALHTGAGVNFALKKRLGLGLTFSYDYEVYSSSNHLRYLGAIISVRHNIK